MRSALLAPEELATGSRVDLDNDAHAGRIELRGIAIAAHTHPRAIDGPEHIGRSADRLLFRHHKKITRSRRMRKPPLTQRLAEHLLGGCFSKYSSDSRKFMPAISVCLYSKASNWMSIVLTNPTCFDADVLWHPPGTETAPPTTDCTTGVDSYMLARATRSPQKTNLPHFSADLTSSVCA